jgi:predicted aspartyl protease
LIIVEAKVWGPRGHTELNLVLDTGSAHTVILPEIVDMLGFNPRDGAVITGVYSAVGKEQGYLIKVPRFSALGFTLIDFPIHVFDLADRYGIDGVLGLSFLHRYNYTVRSAEGLILVEETAS